MFLNLVRPGVFLPIFPAILLCGDFVSPHLMLTYEVLTSIRISCLYQTTPRPSLSQIFSAYSLLLFLTSLRMHPAPRLTRRENPDPSRESPDVLRVRADSIQ